MLYAMLECIYECCGRRLANEPAPLTVEDIVLAMELLPQGPVQEDPQVLHQS